MGEKELCVRIDSSLLENLEDLACDLGKPLDYIVQTALEKYLQDCDEDLY